MDKNSSRKSSDEDVPMQVLIDHNRLDSVSSGRNVPHSQILYTPIHSVDPNEFSEDFRLNRYPLRFFPKEINEKIRIFCVVTMYNEGREELSRTLTGIANNLRALEKKSGYPNFWEEVIVCIVADGRTKLNQDSMDYMIENGICSYEMMASYLDSKNSDPEIPDVSVHLFESVVEFGSDGDVVENGQKMRIMFALKERNAGKIDSHWWFFNAFSVVLNPNYCFVCFPLRFYPLLVNYIFSTFSCLMSEQFQRRMPSFTCIDHLNENRKFFSVGFVTMKIL